MDIHDREGIHNLLKRIETPSNCRGKCRPTKHPLNNPIIIYESMSQKQQLQRHKHHKHKKSLSWQRCRGCCGRSWSPWWWRRWCLPWSHAGACAKVMGSDMMTRPRRGTCAGRASGRCPDATPRARGPSPPDGRPPSRLPQVPLAVGRGPHRPEVLVSQLRQACEVRGAVHLDQEPQLDQGGHAMSTPWEGGSHSSCAPAVSPNFVKKVVLFSLPMAFMRRPFET